MVVIKRVGVLSFAKIEALLLLIFGLVEAIAITLFQAFAPNLLNAQTSAPLNYAAVFSLPLIYAVMGFVMGLVGAWLYNMFAKLVGGIELEFEKETREDAQPKAEVKKRK